MLPEAVVDFIVNLAWYVFLIFLAGWSLFIIATTPSKQDKERAVSMLTRGREFLESIEGTWELEDFAKLPQTTRASVIKQLGYNEAEIDWFITFATNNPDEVKVTNEVYNDWFTYKGTRRGIRWQNWLGGWRV
jgi:hypothetical protein